MSSLKLPSRVIDAHHHFVDTRESGNIQTFQKFLGSLLKDEVYLADQYHSDVVEPLKQEGIILDTSVHVECMPDDGAQEAAWIESIASNDHKCTVAVIVGSADLTSPTIDNDLTKLCATSPKVHGIRWIVDCVGKFEPNTATHVATTRHDGVDYLRGSNGGYDGEAVPEFENGFSLLAKHKLSFDLQCAPAQLPAAARLCARHPNVPVVIDHLGKPRTLLGPDDEEHKDNSTPNPQELAKWRAGMKAMAEVPHVYVKLSMLGYAIPGWIKTPQRREFLQSLVREVVALFSPQRCMAALNWWKNGAVSDSDFLSDVGPTPMEYVQFIATCLEGYSQEDVDRIFYGTAKEFYRI
ncbi:amidohydrolase 2 [Seminavis robusta]|uniref:Amidohydrolase 2 n=1 Tax=Seminavis robusta TaxID=568900 RepID=A0A9N8F343_9STRA|nr:amidohydrolase 2 [Seminavis robusta]|eukprot:Sro4006_g352470.1 amidohydrolase 2 (352) ;mRNA; r:810-1865